ncbi:MAG: HAD hydrolase-like protein [Xanthomonadales bacterium]|nr:HAD hydrolase-like protein [Xanthomonadales bacterium]
MGRSLADFELLSFDCYGTLIDWETGIWDAVQPLLARHGGGLTRDRALAGFGSHESRIQAERPTLPYPDVLAAVHAELAASTGLVTTAELDCDFGRSVPHWPAFADSAEALRSLAQRYRLVILSNVDRASFAASERKLGIRFDAVYTAEDIGSYKPAPRNFDYLVKQVRRDFGLGPDAILHTAQSLHHDHVPARAIGLANAWIDRQGLSRGGGWGATAGVAERPATDFLFYSMGELAAAAAEAQA